MKGFICYKYGDQECEDTVSNLKKILLAHKVTPVDGKDLLATGDRDKQIFGRIDASDFIIAIILKDHNNEFISSEIGYAKGIKIPIVLITDDPSRITAVDSQYKLKFHPGGIQTAAELINVINSISNASQIEELHKANILSEIGQCDWFSSEKSKSKYT